MALPDVGMAALGAAARRRRTLGVFSGLRRGKLMMAHVRGCKEKKALLRKCREVADDYRKLGEAWSHRVLRAGDLCRIANDGSATRTHPNPWDVSGLLRLACRSVGKGNVVRLSRSERDSLHVWMLVLSTRLRIHSK